MLSYDDLLILMHLRKNARKSLAKIGRELNMPISTVFDKVHKLHNNVIIKNTSLIDFAQLGHGLKINYVIKAKKDKTKQLVNLLINNHQVNSVFQLKNENEFYIEAIFRNMVDFDSFTEVLEEYKAKNIKVINVVEELKKEDFLTDIKHIK